MLDLHCHIAPGLDDGAGDESEALAMARGLAELGFATVAATPHLPWDTVSVSVPDFAERLEVRLQGLRRAGCPVELLPGAEHFSDIVPQLLGGQGPLCYPGSNCFLMELPLSGFPARLDELLFRLEVKGWRPLLAHVERYPEVQRDHRVVAKLRQRGARILVNLSGLAGDWGGAAQRAARRLVQDGLVDAVTSDLHHPGGLESVARGLELLGQLAGPEEKERLLRQGPRQMLSGATSTAGGGR